MPSKIKWSYTAFHLSTWSIYGNRIPPFNVDIYGNTGCGYRIPPFNVVDLRIHWMWIPHSTFQCGRSTEEHWMWIPHSTFQCGRSTGTLDVDIAFHLSTWLIYGNTGCGYLRKHWMWICTDTLDVDTAFHLSTWSINGNTRCGSECAIDI